MRTRPETWTPEQTATEGPPGVLQGERLARVVKVRADPVLSGGSGKDPRPVLEVLVDPEDPEFKYTKRPKENVHTDQEDPGGPMRTHEDR
ncbi:hypothetical protein EYF80_061587 [Liparis tanakae]|uniref:Uncharacterized protein n=1 Tax=Liparis tanakae TaxID=230148 RepID=A0A4Z2EHH9_9TELE|nr:hypothetical protein EYF80_061587 [Liparis tanakae]